MHRAFHAMKVDFKAEDGTPTNAVFGFFSMFFKYVLALSPNALICTFDSTKPTKRIELFEKYKANRPHMDPDLKIQFPVVQEILLSMGVLIVTKDGWEADDCMGTLSQICKEANDECYLVTGDKDLNQLVCESVFTVTSDRKNKEVIVRGKDRVFEKFGVWPEQIVDYLALVGDSSDNIPGVAGIGPKSAVELLSKYKTLDGVYDNLSDFKGKRLDNLIEYKKDAYLSQKLATINCNLQLNVDLNNCSVFDFDEDKVQNMLLNYGLRSTFANFKKVVRDLKNASSSTNNNSKRVIDFPKIITFEEARDRLVNLFIQDNSEVGFSYVTPTKAYLKKHESTGPLVGIATYNFMCAAPSYMFGEAITGTLKSSKIVAYDAKDIISLVYPHDNLKETSIGENELLSAEVFDIHVCSNMLNSSLVFKNQEEFFSKSGISYSPESDISKRAMEFAYLSLISKKRQSLILEDDQHSQENELFHLCEMPLLTTLSLIERNGCALDDSIFSDLNQYCERKLKELKDKIFKIAGHEFLIESPAQLSIVLFQEMGIKPVKKNKTGFSTDAKVLKELSDEYEICNLVLNYRELAKMRSTYIDALPKMRSCDKLVHTKFNQAATATGRLSSSEPNLQNIPVRTEFGKKIREAFLPARKGDLFLSADYSQIELRLLAHLSEDPSLIDAFLSGEDFHTQTAMKIFGVCAQDVSEKMRASAKAVNFGIIYGQQAFSLAKQLNIDYKQAALIIEKYYENYPSVRAFLDTTVKEATELGYAKTMFGRKRMIPELTSSNKQIQAFGQRTAMNHPMQGSAADIIKIAMVRLQQILIEEKLKSKIMIQVHDELDLSVAPSELDVVKDAVREVMENVASLKVPLAVDIGVGKNWAEAH